MARLHALGLLAAGSALFAMAGCGGGGGGGLGSRRTLLILASDIGLALMSVNGSSKEPVPNGADAFTGSLMENGDVITSLVVGGNEDIYRLPEDGGAPVRLTTDAGDDFRPIVTPDGSRIVFVTNRDGGDYEVYIMDGDGTNQTNLSNQAGVDYFPAISIDGMQVVFSSERDGNEEIYKVNSNGTGLTRLTFDTAMDTTPAWSPSGLSILFTSDRDGNGEIYRMNADGGSQTRLTVTPSRDEYHASFDVDARWIFFYFSPDVGDREIGRMETNGTGYVELTNDSVDDSKVATWVY